jgi:hypothetical protein
MQYILAFAALCVAATSMGAALLRRLYRLDRQRAMERG